MPQNVPTGICPSCGEGPKQIPRLDQCNPNQRICWACREKQERQLKGKLPEDVSVLIGQRSSSAKGSVAARSQGIRPKVKSKKDMCSFCGNGSRPIPYAHVSSRKLICEVCYLNLERFGLHLFFRRLETPKVDSPPPSQRREQASRTAATAKVKPAIRAPSVSEKAPEPPVDFPDPETPSSPLKRRGQAPKTAAVVKARTEELAVEVSDQGSDDCAHFWAIPSPNGPTSLGTCTKCGAQEEFFNSIPGTGWNSRKPPGEKKEASVT